MASAMAAIHGSSFSSRLPGRYPRSALPTGTTALSVLTQPTGGTAKTLILNPLGSVVGTLNAVSGISTVDLPAPALGIYTIQTINTGTTSVDTLTLATPQVQR